MESVNLIFKLQSLENQLKILRAELTRPQWHKSKKKSAKGALKGLSPLVGEEEFLKVAAAWRSLPL